MRLFLNGKSEKLQTHFDAFEESTERLEDVRLQTQALTRTFREGDPCPYGYCQCHTERKLS